MAHVLDSVDIECFHHNSFIGHALSRLSLKVNTSRILNIWGNLSMFLSEAISEFQVYHKHLSGLPLLLHMCTHPARKQYSRPVTLSLVLDGVI